MKTKKLLSILLAAILMVGCVGITASAEGETVTVSLLGEKQATISEEYEVILNVEETKADLVGGISCDVKYNATKFTLKRIEISEEFASANELSDDLGKNQIINTNVSGVVSIVLIAVSDDVAKSNWLTLVFDVNANQDDSTASFELENVKASNSTGTKLVTQDLNVELVNNNIYSDVLTLNGASIRKDADGNLRFEVEIDKTNFEKYDIAEIGFIILPTIYIDNGDLTVTATKEYSSIKYGNKKMAINSKDVSEFPNLFKDDDNKVYGYLTNTMNYKKTTSFSARAFVLLENGKYIYSDNQVFDTTSKTYIKDIKGGTSSKSVIKTAKAIYNLYKDKENAVFSEEFKNIIVKDSWDDTEYKTIVSELAKVEDSFN